MLALALVAVLVAAAVAVAGAAAAVGAPRARFGDRARASGSSLGALPAGRLLVSSAHGTWIVAATGRGCGWGRGRRDVVAAGPFVAAWRGRA